MLWLELTGRVERTETEAMRWGKLLEHVITDELDRRGYAVMPGLGESVTDSSRPWLIGHPDGVVEMDYEPVLLEVETAGTFAGKWGLEPPVQYVAQCQVYMHLTGLDRALLACLVGGQRLELRTVTRHDAAIAALLERMEHFYGFVERDEPPPPDGSDSARDALYLMYPEAREGLAYRLTAAEHKLYRELMARREQRDVVDRQVTELENTLKAAMGEAEIALSPNDAEVLRWRNTSRKALDVSALRAALPELAEKYSSTTESRRFTVV